MPAPPPGSTRARGRRLLHGPRRGVQHTQERPIDSVSVVMTTVTLRGPDLAVQTCARRLAPLGVQAPSRSGGEDGFVLDWDDTCGCDGDLEVDLSWFGPARLRSRLGSEAVVQALSGLMCVHGRDSGGPRRIGLEVASVAAGVLAAQAAVAALVGRSRGVPVTTIESSVLQAALLLVSHRIAASTCGNEWVPAAPGPAPGPPFHSAEGRLFEVETLDPSAWKAFWERLGAADADLARAWTLFRARFFRGTCTLPEGLHEATAAHPLAETAAIAAEHGVSLCPVRGYHEVLTRPGWSDGHPTVRMLASLTGAPGVTATSPPPADRGPLAGLRVVETTNRLQGPLAGLLLYMLGAEVVRVEPPGGDLTRTVPPMAGDTGSFFLSFNRGKQAVELDLARPRGRTALFELVAGADVFLHNWRPDKAAEWGLTADDLAAANPRLVYAEASGWGGLSDTAHLVGTDFLVQAYSGVAAGITQHGRPPVPSRALLIDYAGGLVTCEAVLWGLLRRERSGLGQHAEASLLAGAMTLQAHVLEVLAGGRGQGRCDGQPLWGVLDHPLSTADGFIVVTVESDDDLRRLCEVCGVDLDRCSAGGVEAFVAERIAHGPTLHWEERLNAAGLPCAAVCTDLAELSADPQLVELFESLPAGGAVPAAPWRLT